MSKYPGSDVTDVMRAAMARRWQAIEDDPGPSKALAQHRAAKRAADAEAQAHRYRAGQAREGRGR